MNFDYKKYNAFNNKYINKRKNLNNITIQMIDTMFCFIHRDKVNNKKEITKHELLEEFRILLMVIEKYQNETLLRQFELLAQQFFSGDYSFIPLFIKIQCSVGIYPNEIFIDAAKKIFDDEIYIPMMNGSYEDPYAENKFLPLGTDCNYDTIKQHIKERAS